MLKISYIVFFIFFMQNFIFADNHKIFQWQYETNKISEGKYEITLNVNIPNNWFIYGMNISEGKGPLPINFDFEETDNINVIKEFYEAQKPDELFDEIFKINVSYYDKSASFKSVVELKNNIKNTKLIIDGQACYLVDYTCVRVYDEIIIEF